MDLGVYRTVDAKGTNVIKIQESVVFEARFFNLPWQSIPCFIPPELVFLGGSYLISASWPSRV